MNIRFSHSFFLQIAKIATLAYLLIFEAWSFAPDYPQGVLKDQFSAVGIFHLLPGPLPEAVLTGLAYLWPVALLLALIPRFTRWGLSFSFLIGCYVLGYAYNYGRVFHGTSLILQILLLLAVGWPARKATPEKKEARARLLLRYGQLLIGLAYFSSGITKLLRSGFDWALSGNLAVILHTQALTTPFQDWLLSWPSSYLSVLGLAILLVELTSLLPFFLPRLGALYVFFWASFHVAVYFAMGGHATFFSHFFLYTFFLPSFLPKAFLKNNS